MEPYIPITMLNDFIFCPRSIYFHLVHGGVDQNMYNMDVQIKGKAVHSTIENQNYSTRASVLMGMDVFCEKYNILGKIDIFDVTSGKLIERKNKVTKIYDGYIFQVYAQTFALREMGHDVNKIVIHDITHNKNFDIPLPEEDTIMFNKFEKVINDINSYDLHSVTFTPNVEKCKRCIYSNLCDYYTC